MRVLLTLALVLDFFIFHCSGYRVKDTKHIGKVVLDFGLDFLSGHWHTTTHPSSLFALLVI